MESLRKLSRQAMIEPDAVADSVGHHSPAPPEILEEAQMMPGIGKLHFF